MRPTSTDAARRLRDTRERIERLMWAARVRVIREQLISARRTLPS